MADVETTDIPKDLPDSHAQDDLPQKILEKYSSELQVQIIKGYRILQVIVYYLKNDTFLSKPVNEKRASKFYYDVIENPMWFNEIKRKIFDAEYNSLAEIIKDIRLVFENCYYFWGPRTAMSEQCVKLECLMEKQLCLLPRDLRSSCSLEETHGKNDDNIVTKIWNRYRNKGNKGKGCSNLMLRAWRKRRILEEENYRAKSDLANYCDNKKQILRWEKDVLRLEDHSSSISNVAQLPQIGQFFRLITDLPQIKTYCQMEIERMFLIPYYCSTFEEILTSLLTDEAHDEPPSLDDLMTKLNNLLDEWYSIYENKDRDRIEAARTIGIEAEFFKIVGQVNPLATMSYESLPYCKKVVILKSLCDYSVRKNCDIKNAITKADEKNFAPKTIGRDKFGYEYLFFDTFLDFRLYKKKISENDVHSDKQSSCDLLDYENVSLKKFFSKGCSDFKMVADSVERLRCLIDELIYSDIENSKKDGKLTNYEIIESLRDLENRVIENENLYIERTNQARLKLYKEWKTRYSRFHTNNSDVDNFPSEYQEDVSFACEADDSNNGSPASKSTFSKSIENTDEDETRFSSNTTDETKDDGSAVVYENDEQFTHEADLDDFLVKTEIKEEQLNDEFSSSEALNASGRRRRSSVASYNVFDKKLFFSDESDSESPEEIYTEGDDSDDDWDVPKKRSKKSKNKLTKQLKLNAEDANRKRKKNNSKRNDVEPLCDKVDDSFLNIEHTIKKEEELHIMDTNTANSEEIHAKDEDRNKSGSKIKVVDLAKLQKSVSASGAAKTKEETLMPRIISQGTLRISQSTPMNAVPMMSNAVISTPDNAGGFSTVRPTFAIVGQPRVISNAYIITTNQGSFSTATSQYQMQPYASPVYGTQGVAITANAAPNSRMPRIVNTAGAYVNNVTPNNKLVLLNQNSPIRFSPSAAPQGVKSSSNFPNKALRFRPSQTPASNRQPSVPSLNVKNTYVNSSMASKLGRNVTVIPKVINKINEKGNSFKEIEGSIGMHSNNGTLQYVVNLANGTHVPLTLEQVQKLRDGNNGALPLKLKIPVPTDVAEKIEPCVVIDD